MKRGERKPMFGTVALLGGLYVIHFGREGTASSIRHEGYSPDVFKDCPEDMPVVRFDLSPENSVFESIRGPVKYIKGHHGTDSGNQREKWYTLDGYLAEMRRFGVVVQTLAEMRAPVGEVKQL